MWLSTKVWEINMNIRNMKIEDYTAVNNLWLNTKGMGLNNLDDSLEGIQKYLQRNPKTCFVGLENEEIIGAILAGHDGRRAYIYHCAVKENKRYQGFGKRLVELALNALKDEGIHKVACVVFKDNLSGQKFWESCGFNCREDLTYLNKNLSELERIDMK